MTNFNERANGWRPFDSGLRLCEFEAGPSDGPLHSLHQPTVTRIQGRVLISLSVSTGVPPSTIGAVLDQAAAELLDKVRAGNESAPLETVRQEVWRMFQAGRFDRGVPDIMAVVPGDGEKLRVWRAGPNGLALTGNGQVHLASEDLRMAALHRLGAALDERWSKDPLLAEVSELTQIEPSDSSRQELVVDLHDGCALLMSRGAMPFAAPSNPVGTAEWWGRDAGWRHGLGATVVAIAAEGFRSEGTSVLSTLAGAINQARSG